MKLLIFSVSLFLAISYGSGQVLERIVVQSTLPFIADEQTGIYDGGDNIYLVGGFVGGAINSVHRYKISSDIIDEIGNTNRVSYGGVAQFGTDGNAYIVGDYPYNAEQVLQLNPQTSTVTPLDYCPFNFFRSVSIKPNASSDEMHIFSSFTSHSEVTTDIRTYNMDTKTWTVSGQLPIQTYNIKAAVVAGRKAFLFGEYEFQNVLLDLDTMESKLLSIPEFPRLEFTPNVVYDGKHIYVIGGHRTFRGESRCDGIIQLDPVTLALDFLPVKNFPFGDPEDLANSGWPVPHTLMVAPYAVYSEERNRIYLLGGKNEMFNYPNPINKDIAYIDLEPLNPKPTTTTETPTTTTTQKIEEQDPALCLGKEEGIYQHPNNCSNFIGCHDGATVEYSCPDDLLFDPILRNCNLPSDVECYQSCKDKEDGIYPHLGDCGYFVICKEGKSHPFQCPSGLMFDLASNICNFEEVAQCHV